MFQETSISRHHSSLAIARLLATRVDTAHYSGVPITVSLVEDDHRMRESFAAMLNHSPTLRCVSAYATAEEGVLEMPQAKPDVALVDIHLPGMDGIECVAKLK